MEADTPVHEDMRLLVMAPKRLDPPERNVRLIGVHVFNLFSFHRPYEALNYTWGEQDSVDDFLDIQEQTVFIETEEEQRGNTCMDHDTLQPWHSLVPTTYDRSTAKAARSRANKNLGTMQIWKTEQGQDGSKRREEDRPADLPPTVDIRASDSRKDSSTLSACWTPSCRFIFLGKHRRGHLRRHMRAKHDAQRHVGRSRHQTLAYTIFLTAAQLACTIPLHNYDHCHGDVTCRPPIASRSLLYDSPPFFDFLGHPTTNAFVLSALAYGAAAMYQYHINDGDRFQQLCLIIGVATGFLLSVASPAVMDGQRAMTSTMAMAITVALLISALGHGFHAMLSSKDTYKDMVADEEKRVGENEV